MQMKARIYYELTAGCELSSRGLGQPYIGASQKRTEAIDYAKISNIRFKGIDPIGIFEAIILVLRMIRTLAYRPGNCHILAIKEYS